MASIHQFPRYTGPENFVTNNTLLLLGRVYQTDQALFQRFLNSLIDGGEVTIGPTFNQQSGNGGTGIPDGMIAQSSFKIVVEAKLYDAVFWGKEDYVTHFRNETTRILMTLSKEDIVASRKVEFREQLAEYDAEVGAIGATHHLHLTYSLLVASLRQVIEETRTRFKVELEDLLDDYEEFVASQGLFDDIHVRMHVPSVRNTIDLNLEHNLYFNQTTRNESPHKFIGLYNDKAVRYIGETKVIVIPVRNESGVLEYTFLKGEELFTDKRRLKFEAFLEEFVEDEGYGDDGGLKYHLFDSLHETFFEKTSPYGIWGPRHFYLTDYLDNAPNDASAEWVAEALDGEKWE